MAAKKGKAGATKKRESLVVGSKCKDFIRSKNLMAAGDLLDAISDKVYAMLEEASSRVEANKRSTMRPHDL
jgi:hypothetical protein